MKKFTIHDGAIAREWRVVCLHDAPIAAAICVTPADAVAYWTSGITSNPHHNPDVESLYVLHLNTRNKITGHHLVSTGTLDTILVHAREVFRAAIVANAFKVVIMHNHPSGDPTPSDADIRVTRDLIRAGQLLKIEVCDHVIVGKPEHRSLRELGHFYGGSI